LHDGNDHVSERRDALPNIDAANMLKSVRGAQPQRKRSRFRTATVAGEKPMKKFGFADNEAAAATGHLGDLIASTRARRASCTGPAGEGIHAEEACGVPVGKFFAGNAHDAY
jgi:hypothetical protein